MELIYTASNQAKEKQNPMQADLMKIMECKCHSIFWNTTLFFYSDVNRKIFYRLSQ